MNPLVKTLAVLSVLISLGVPAVCQVPMPTEKSNIFC